MCLHKIFYTLNYFKLLFQNNPKAKWYRYFFLAGLGLDIVLTILLPESLIGNLLFISSILLSIISWRFKALWDKFSQFEYKKKKMIIISSIPGVIIFVTSVSNSFFGALFFGFIVSGLLYMILKGT